MRRDFIYAGILWLVLTAVGEVLAVSIDLNPLGLAAEAEIIDEAFQLLMVLGVPVFAFVVAGLIYAVLRFRVADDSDETGTAIRSNRAVTWTWLVVTSVLAIYIIIDPGITGLRALQAGAGEDLIVQVEAQQWQWSYTYPQYGVSIQDANELVLPIGHRVKFEITSTDVIHSLWIPAFRMKMDAVPGRTNVMFVTPTETGSFDEDSAVRVQCAELCGTGHPRMRTGLRVVEEAEFEAWIEQNR